MLYKTIALHLLEENPIVYDQLRQEHKALEAVEKLANELKTRHENLTSHDSNEASSAMELASNEVETNLRLGGMTYIEQLSPIA